MLPLEVRKEIKYKSVIFLFQKKNIVLNFQMHKTYIFHDIFLNHKITDLSDNNLIYLTNMDKKSDPSRKKHLFIPRLVYVMTAIYRTLYVVLKAYFYINEEVTTDTELYTINPSLRHHFTWKSAFVCVVSGQWPAGSTAWQTCHLHQSPECSNWLYHWLYVVTVNYCTQDWQEVTN